MPPEIDAEGIWQLVKDWPREAWPVPVESSVEIEYLFNNRNDLDAAEIMCLSCAFVGAGLAWLAEKRTHAVCGSRVSVGDYYSPLREWNNYDGEILLAAVSAAVLAAAKEYESS